MYSEDVNKVCKLCVFAKPVAGIVTHMKCSSYNSYIRIEHVCSNFKYDILKKPVKRKKDITKLGFTASDFSID